MAQSISLNLTPRTHNSKPGMVEHTGNSSTGEAEACRILRLAGQPAFVSSRLVRGPISKEIKVDNSLGTAAEAEVTLGSYMHGLTQAPAQIPTYTTV